MCIDCWLLWLSFISSPQDPMKIKQATFVLTVALCPCLLSSCGLVKSLVKIPAGIVKTAVRTAGVNNLTDNTPQPAEPVDPSQTGEAPLKPSAVSEEPLAEQAKKGDPAK